MNKYAGSERLEKMKVWRKGSIVDGKRIKGHWHQVVASDLGKEIADILGQAWKGLYHLDETAIDWENDSFIEVNICESLSTWDFNRLTEIVVLCHDRAVRMEINACNMTYLKLRFHRRKRGEGMCWGHPKMERAVQMIRESIGLEIIEAENPDD